MQRMLTVDEAADVLRHSKYTIRRWIKQGKLKAARVGRRYLITEEAIQEIIAPQARKKLSPKESIELMHELQAEGARLGIGPETYKRVIAEADEREARDREEIARMYGRRDS